MEKTETKKTDRFIRKKELTKIVGLSATTIWRRIKEGSFPRAVSIGTSAIAWRLSEVEEWMSSRQVVK